MIARKQIKVFPNRRRLKTKAQIQMMETIAVLLIFMILVAFGLIFFSKILRTRNVEKQQEFQDLSTVQIAQIASTLPELQCSSDNILKSNCVDIGKIDAFSSGPVDPNDYFDIFGFSTITIQEVFPDPAAAPFDIYEKKPPTTAADLVTHLPISLYDPLTDTYKFGYMKVVSYIIAR